MKRSFWVVGLLVIASLLTLLPAASSAAVGDTSRYVGQRNIYDGRKAVDAYLDAPQGFVFDSTGNIFVADTKNNTIRKIDGTTTKISSYANVSGEYGRQDGFRPAGTTAEPEAIALDRINRVYVADTLNSVIRRIEGNSLITLPIPGLSRPRGLTIRGNEIYISDTGHNRIVKTDLDGGAPKLVAAPMSRPTKLDWVGRKLYVVNEGNGSVVEVDLTQVNAQRRLAGGFQDLGGIAAYQGKYLYVTSGKQGVNNEIYKVEISTGKKTLLASRRETEWLNWASDTKIYKNRLYVLFGGGSSIYSFDLNGQDEQKVAGIHRFGDQYGTPTQTILGRPHTLVWSSDGQKMYFVQNSKLIQFNIVDKKTTYLAGHVMDNYVEGTGEAVRFSDPTQIVLSPDNKTIYLADRNNHRIRKFDIATRTSSYLTGAGKTNFYGEYSAYQEGGPCADVFTLGQKGCAYFNRPTGLAINKAGTKLYVADSGNNRIREVDIKSGKTRLLAGNGNAGYTDGFGPLAELNGPYNLALDQNGISLYITDKQNHVIRSLDINTLNISTVTGAGRAGYREGSGRNAVLNYPEGIIVGTDQNLYFTDAGNQRVRMFDFDTGRTRTISGNGTRGLYMGSGDSTRWNNPKGIAQRGTDGSALYVCDYYNDMIDKVMLR